MGFGGRFGHVELEGLELLADNRRRHIAAITTNDYPVAYKKNSKALRAMTKRWRGRRGGRNLG